MANSPLIANGQLNLSATGDLADGLDIQTQMAVGVSGYNCLYSVNLDSQLIPYLNNPKGSVNRDTIVNIIKNAYAYMVNNKIINNLQIGIPVIVLSNVFININATDLQGNKITLKWTNL